MIETEDTKKNFYFKKKNGNKIEIKTLELNSHKKEISTLNDRIENLNQDPEDKQNTSSTALVDNPKFISRQCITDFKISTRKK